MKNRIFKVPKVFAFRQWSRKSYAVFSSLGLLIKISVLSVAYTLVNPVQECKAQTDSTDATRKVELEEVEVSGQRAPVVYSQIARVVSVITRDESEQAPVQSLNELLEDVPQVDVRQRGTNGVQADLSIQGGSFDQTLILLDGFNLSDPQTGHHNLNLPIDLESADRIEILKGPASRVFGTNAFSGAVNFITGENRADYIKTKLTTGAYGLYEGAVYLNKHSKNTSQFIGISKNVSSGYITNTDYNNIQFFYHGQAMFKPGKVHLLFGYNEKEFGANDFYSPKFPSQRENTSTWFSGLKFETGKKLKITPSLYWRRNYDHFKILISNQYFHNYHFSDVYGADLNSTFQSVLGKSSFGVDIRKEIIYSTNLGHPTDDSIKIKGKDLYYTLTDQRLNASFFAEQDIYLGKFSVSAGFMLNRNTKIKQTQLYPGVDLGYQLFPNWKIYTTLNRSLRLPTFTDLYYHGPQNIGNPGLLPEQAWTYEAGLKMNRKGVDAHVSYFHRKGSNIIDWIWQQDIQKWHTENLTRLNTDGVEMAVDIKPSELLNRRTLIRRLGLSYAYTNVSKSDGDFISYYALDNLKHKLSLELVHQVIKDVNASWRVMWQDRNGTYSQWQSPASQAIQTPYPSFWIFDGKIYYTRHQYRFFAECTNLFNTQYVDIGNIMQPGRWFKAGMTLTLGI